MKRLILAAALIFTALAHLLADTGIPNGTGAPDETQIDDGWRLWLDPQAEWKSDKLYLPDEVDLAKLPVNPPTGGWDVLNDQAGIPVTLPGTVEEHYWGKPPLPVADSSRPESIVRLGSGYHGVSWWWRDFTPPPLAPGEHLIISFLGAQLRTEVYVNGKLVGYNLITEIPYTAAATSAIQPGRNRLAVRITSSGGHYSWGDYGINPDWGDYHFQNPHGFSGINGGVTFAIRGPVSIDDLYVQNHPDPHTVTLNVEAASTGPAYKGPVALSISRDGAEVWNGAAEVDVPANGTFTASVKATVANAELWGIGHPVLYRASAHIASIPHSGHVTDFGFRWFNAEDIGANPHLALNGRRILVRSAISWGYWAPNGNFPDKAAVQREIDAVRALGQNCVQNHRSFPKAAVLDGFDQAGLLRYCEPGGGSSIWDETVEPKPHYPPGPVDTSGQGGEPVTFANRFELFKLLAMIKAYRSHPSIPLWSINNETGANIHNPKIFYAMRKAHELDPSRILILKSGFGPEGEIMARPYSDDYRYGEKSTHHESGWDDNHNEGNEGTYQDSFWNGPDDYYCRSDDTIGIAMWGELGTGNSPDDAPLDVQWYANHNATGYTLAAQKARTDAYNAFLDKYGFRQAFPTASDLFRAVGARQYFLTSHMIENVRCSDANDYFALSGWESTTVDNNSGIVDSLRFLKGDPAIVHDANAPEHLVIHARHYVVAKGGNIVADAYLADETGRNGSYTLHFTAAMDDAQDKPFYDASYAVNLAGGEVFGQLLKDGIAFPAPRNGGVTLTASLLAPGSSTPVLTHDEPLWIADTCPAPITRAVAWADFDGRLGPALQKAFNLNAVPLASAPAKSDVIVVSSAGTARFAWIGRMLSADNVQNTADPGLYRQQWAGVPGDVAHFGRFAPGDLTVELFFAEPQSNQPGHRVFDVSLNGQDVLKNFDIAAEAGGQARAVVKEFTVPSPDGTLDLAVPKVEQGAPVIAAIRIADSKGQVHREVFRKDNYTDPAGIEWHSASQSLAGFDWPRLIPTVLDRVRAGSRLVLLGMDGKDMDSACKALADAGVFTYSGLAGFDDTPWVGHWYFVKKHWLFDGLPTDCVFSWQYQAAAGGDGLKIDAPGLEAPVGYGMNPGPGLGLGAAVVPLGKGQVVLYCIPGLTETFLSGDPKLFQPVTARRMVYNAIAK